MSEFEPAPTVQTLEFNIHDDDNWTSLEEVPRDLRRVVDIYSNALNDDVGAETSEVEDIDTFYEIYDQISDQSCLVARSKEGIIGVASYDFGRTPPFIDGYAVDSEFRDLGVASGLLAEVIKRAKSEGIAELRLRSQPSALDINRKLLSSIKLDYTVDHDQKYPLIKVYID